MGSELTALYLHGSLAMGCFNPARSDVDLLAITRSAIPLATKKALVEFLLEISGAPHPLEISILRPEDMNPWRYPVPFELHFSEEWRKPYSRDVKDGAWKDWDGSPRTDPDLAAHITVTRARGICLAGTPAEKILPCVPRKDFLASLIADLVWAQGRLKQDTVYGILNACRVHAYLQDGRVYSKEEGADQALRTLPAEFHPLIQSALEIYCGHSIHEHAFDAGKTRRLIHSTISAAKAAL